MENKPFFSIVIPAYNCAGTIRATMESIAAQTVSDFEVIIVNDGSKDATADVLQGFANMDSRFSFITIPNNGPGNARNQGIARAQGRYLFLMDADDEIEQHTLERYQTILTGEAPDLIVASYNLRVLDNQEIVSEKQVIAEDRTYTSNTAFLENLYPLMNKQLMYVIWNKIYRLDIIREHQIAFPSYSSCEDRLFNIAYYRHAQKVVTTSEVLYQYAFEGKSSLTNKYFDNKFETFLEFYNELLDLTDKDLGGFSALFLKGTMSCIIPLHGASCPLDWAGKKAYIKKILQHPRVQYATANSLTDTPIRKIMKLLFRSKSIYLNYIASGMMHLLSNASPKLIEKLKGNFQKDGRTISMTQPKRVLHFQGRMGKGGAETFMMNAYRNIDRSKYQFDFVIYEEFADVRPYHDEIAALGGKIFVVPNPNKHPLRYINTVSKLLQENQVDVVHNEIFFGGGLNLWLAAKAGVKKRIAHSHATSDGKGNRFPYSVVRPIFNNLMMKYATDFIGCSDEAGIGLFGKQQPFVMLPNGIDLDRYRNVPVTKAEMHAQLGIPANAFVIGHIGRFEEQKNHRLLLKIVQHILKKHPNTYLMSVGAGSLEAEIHGLAKELKIEDHVLFLGEREDIAELLKAMDVFLLPSLYEGLPIVAVEAQAANVKLVLSTEVSKDTVLSENVRFVPLDAELDRWEAEIMGDPQGNRPKPEMEAFDMLKTAKALEKIYDATEGTA